MDGRDKLPDDGKIQPQGREDEAAAPRAEGGENTPERFPAVKKDDSVEPPAEQRTFEGDTASPEPRREPDPSVSHGQSDSEEAAPDDGRR